MLYRNIIVALTFVVLVGCAEKEKDHARPTTKGIVYGDVTEFPGPFKDTTDIASLDISVGGDPLNGYDVGLAVLKAPDASGNRLPGLYISPTDAPNWREVGTNFFAQHANARGMLLNMSNNDTMFCVIQHDTSSPTSSIYKTTDGGKTWSDVVLGVPGVITSIVSGDTLLSWGGINGTTPFREEWDRASGTFTSAPLPTVPASPQYTMPRNGDVLYGSMESQLFGRIYAGPVTNWGELLPQQPFTLPVGEEVLFAYGTYGATGQSSAPAIILGRYGYRDAQGYHRYPTTIAQPVSGVGGHKWRWWLVDAANEVWTYGTRYSNSPNAGRWERVYGGFYPTFHASTKVNSAHFANGPTLTTWIVSEGTTLLVHKWEY